MYLLNYYHKCTTVKLQISSVLLFISNNTLLYFLMYDILENVQLVLSLLNIFIFKCAKKLY